MTNTTDLVHLSHLDALEAEAIRDEKVKVLHAIQPLTIGPAGDVARAQYAAGMVAALASTAQARWYALLLAAAATLAANPRSVGDPGWQLSFAAVVAPSIGQRSIGQ